MNTWKVYKHTNLVNGKVYIGITSGNPQHRWNGGRGYKGQPKFFNAILKYGWDGFSHEVLVDNLTREQACVMERELISAHNSITDGYNISPGGDMAGTDNPTSVRVDQIDLSTGSVVKTFDSQLEAARAFGLSRTIICRVCRGYKQSAAGYGWVYHDINFDKPAKQTPVPKPVLQCDLDGTLLAEYKSVNAASKITGVDRHNIARCCDGYYRQLNGYVWKWGR